VQFSSLKLVGFKSFVDPIELAVEPGLTGIVGPNGCGKSNLVEALRWVMGETSARQMRGGEMDDVIFNGTAERPARNLAEVVLHLDNGARDAPAAFNDSPELEVSRRIERGQGSAYHVNGKEARARDVQLLFADAATGARSTAMVSQGQVGAIINAKPIDRRHLLEEAAGITGLHSRRHEAELRLRAAETNLARLDDVIAALDNQLQALKRQARQAARYRSLSGRLRKAEAALLYSRWSRAAAELAEARARLAEAEVETAEHTAVAARAARAQVEAAETLPSLRQAEVAAAAEVHRIAVALDGIDAEQARVRAAADSLARQATQIEADLAREHKLRAEAEQRLVDLANESGALVALQARETEAEAEARAALDAARAGLAECERRVAMLAERIAANEVKHQELQRRQAELDDRRGRLAARAEDVAGELAALVSAKGADLVARAEAVLAASAALADSARANLDQAVRHGQAADATRAEAEQNERAARECLQALKDRHARLVTEIATLAELLEPGASAGASAPAVIDRIAVEGGFELALGAALGEDLDASTDPAAPAHWRRLDSGQARPALPPGALALAQFVAAPAELADRLGQIGVVDAADGPRLQAALAQGQRLVSREGGLWRWDGYSLAADAPGAAALRLKQRNRLGDLRRELTGVEGALAEESARYDSAHAALAAAQADYQAARSNENDARAAANEADGALTIARDEYAAAVKAEAAAGSRRAALDEASSRLAADRVETDADLAAVHAALAELPRPELLRGPLEEARGARDQARATLDACFETHARLAGEITARRQRLAAIAADGASWRDRAEETLRQIEQLEARRHEIATQIESLRARPAELAEARRRLMDQSEAAEARRNAAADALSAAEAALGACDKALRDANARLADCRETKIRIEGRVEQAVALTAVEAQRIQETLSCGPDAALAVAEVESPDAVPPLAELERAIERLLRERDSLGGVNLRAEIEAQELTEKIETMTAERADLIGAIQRLRAGITSLNREGRERLLAAFETINLHFQSLFGRLFGGGQAHLTLVGDNDPLEAGLEIMASPPGKRLQSLSLLSGGEKALAALALLFAVFLTKPAPICVLDEVDAPLDDTNVDRFCDLVEDIARQSETRFLIITHHRLTMARMDRLFGVTMAERGVSQLVSVSLSNASELQAAE